MFEDETMLPALQTFFLLTLWCDSKTKRRRFCNKLRKHLSSLQGVRDLGFLVTMPGVIPVTQEDPKNRHSSWKSKLLFVYGSLSNIAALQLMKDDLNSELKVNCTYNPAMQYFYLWTKWKELGGTTCLLNYIRNKGLIFWSLKYVFVSGSKIQSFAYYLACFPVQRDYIITVK